MLYKELSFKYVMTVTTLLLISYFWLSSLTSVKHNIKKNKRGFHSLKQNAKSDALKIKTSKVNGKNPNI